MDRILTLEVPEGMYEPLARMAEQMGRSPEEIAREWLLTAIRAAAEDPLESFIGAFRSDVPDWADQHDKYLAQTMMGETKAAADQDP